LVSGTCVQAAGRNQDSSWLYIMTDNVSGWVAASLMTVDGSANRLFVIKAVGVEQISTLEPPSATSNPLVSFLSATPTWVNPFQSTISLCSEMGNQIGNIVTCKIARAYCYYRPSTNGSPTFCDDKPYPNHDFQLVVFGEDWSDLGSSCLIVSGYMDSYGGKLQILATSRSQISYCE
jgi:hypothetical protein